ncbi:MAG: 2,3-bisphosphoglycerate-independent phosphoglycerate mutase [Candidatus Thermoplasmatota archaeon]|nr:2,3-bisphosphoglycerate-independent phosphoglycerate mutase [Candidatus Thermoplasmatota archaeon]
MSGKILMLILDGIGDRSVKELEGKTPLEAAETPNLNRFAKEGENGLMDTIAPGIRPGSDTGHLSLLGYDPYEAYTGRGPFEAAGIGMDLGPQDVAFRCNFATLEDGKIVDRRAGRIKEGTEELAEAVRDIDLDVDFKFEKAVEHRAVLVLKGEALGGGVNDIDPHETGTGYHEATPLENSKENKRTARILNKFVRKSIDVLSDHPINKKREKEGKLPANVILPRGGGKVPELEDIQTKHDLNAGAIAGIPLVRGVCSLSGMDVIEVEGATGGLDTDLDSIIDAIIEGFEDNEFILANIKGPDLSGHDGKAKDKIDFIENIDSSVGKLRELEETYIAITGDHSTPVTVMEHSGDPLPLTIWGEDVRTDDVDEFNERACSNGGINRISGGDLLNILKDLADLTEKFGA